MDPFQKKKFTWLPSFFLKRLLSFRLSQKHKKHIYLVQYNLTATPQVVKELLDFSNLSVLFREYLIASKEVFIASHVFFLFTVYAIGVDDLMFLTLWLKLPNEVLTKIKDSIKKNRTNRNVGISSMAIHRIRPALLHSNTFFF